MWVQISKNTIENEWCITKSNSITGAISSSISIIIIIVIVKGWV